MEVKKKNGNLKRIIAGALAVLMVGSTLPGNTFSVLKPVVASATQGDKYYFTFTRSDSDTSCGVRLAEDDEGKFTVGLSGLGLENVSYITGEGVEYDSDSGLITIGSNTQYINVTDSESNSFFFTVSKAALIDLSTNASVEVDKADKSVSVTVDTTTLRANLDYTVSYVNQTTEESSPTFPTEPGTYKAKVTAEEDGAYTGSKESEAFTIGESSSVEAASANDFTTAIEDQRSSIKLIEDITINTSDNLNIDYEGVSIDLNGHTLTVSGAGSFFITDRGTATIKDSSTTGGAFSGVLMNRGKLTIEGGAFTGGVNNYGKMYISGGSFIGDCNFYKYDEGGFELVLTGGKYKKLNHYGAYDINPSDYVAKGYGVKEIAESESEYYEVLPAAYFEAIPKAKENLSANGSGQALIDITDMEVINGVAKYGILDTSHFNYPVAPAYIIENPDEFAWEITWDTSVPTATAGGTYYVFYKAEGNAGYLDSEAGVIPVEISGASLPALEPAKATWSGYTIINLGAFTGDDNYSAYPAIGSDTELLGYVNNDDQTGEIGEPVTLVKINAYKDDSFAGSVLDNFDYYYIVTGVEDETSVKLFEKKCDADSIVESGTLTNKSGQTLYYYTEADADTERSIRNNKTFSGAEFIASESIALKFDTAVAVEIPADEIWSVGDADIRDFIKRLYNEEEYAHVYVVLDSEAAEITEKPELEGNFYVEESTLGSKEFDVLRAEEDDTLVATLTSGNAYYGEAVEAAVKWEGYAIELTGENDEIMSIPALKMEDIEIAYSYAMVGQVGKNGATPSTSTVVVSEYYDTFAALCEAKGIDTVEELYTTKYSVKATINYKVGTKQKNVSMNTFFNYVKKDLDLVAVTIDGEEYQGGIVIRDFDGKAYEPKITLEEDTYTTFAGEDSDTTLPFDENDYEFLGYYDYNSELFDGEGNLIADKAVTEMVDTGNYAIVYQGKGNYKSYLVIPIDIRHPEFPTVTINPVTDKEYGTAYTAADFGYKLSKEFIETEDVKTAVTYTFYAYDEDDGYVEISDADYKESDPANTKAEVLKLLKDCGKYKVVIKVENDNYETEDGKTYVEVADEFEITRKLLEITLPEVMTLEYGQEYTEEQYKSAMENTAISGFVDEDGETVIDNEEHTAADLLKDAVLYGVSARLDEEDEDSDILVKSIATDSEKLVNVGTYRLVYTGSAGIGTYNDDAQEPAALGWIILPDNAPEVLNNYYYVVQDGTITAEEPAETHESVLTIVPKKAENVAIFDTDVEGNLKAGIVSQTVLEGEEPTFPTFEVYIDGVLAYDNVEGFDVADDKYICALDESVLTITPDVHDGSHFVSIVLTGNFTGEAAAMWNSLTANTADYRFIVEDTNGTITIDGTNYSDFTGELTYNGKTLGETVILAVVENEEYALAAEDEGIVFSYFKDISEEGAEEPVWIPVNDKSTKNVGKYLIKANIELAGKYGALVQQRVAVNPAGLNITINNTTTVYGEEPEDVSYTIGETTLPTNLVNKALKDVKFTFTDFTTNEPIEGVPTEVGEYQITAAVESDDPNIEFDYDGTRIYSVVKKDIATAGITYTVGENEVDALTWATADGENALVYTTDFDLEEVLKAEYAIFGAEEAADITDQLEVVWVKKEIDKTKTTDSLKFYLKANADSKYYTGQTPVITVIFKVDGAVINAAITEAIEKTLDLKIAESADAAAAGKVKFEATRKALADDSEITVKTFGVKVIYCDGEEITAASEAEAIKKLFTDGLAKGTANAKTPETTTTYKVTAPGTKGTWGAAYATVEYKGELFTVYSDVLCLKADEEKFVSKMIMAEYDESIQKLKFNYNFTVPSSYKTIKVGVIAASNNTLDDITNIDEDLTLSSDKPEFIKAFETDVSNGLYLWTKKNISDNDIWYVRGYTIYEDSDGYRFVIYSEIVASTKTSTERITTTSRNGAYAYVSSITPNETLPSKMMTVSKYSVPANVTVQSAGVIATINVATANNGLTIDTVPVNGETYVKTVAPTSQNTRLLYSWSKKDATGQTWYVRPYVTYTISGNTLTVYGDMTSYTME